jgi:radical SAM protein with 4Fe4S-binding SPASM domain
LKEIQISLDGPKHVHEYWRGLGSYDRAMNALRKCKDNGIYTAMRATLSTVNYDKSTIEMLIHEFIKSDADEFRVRAMINVGRANNSEYLLQPSQLMEAIEVLSRYQRDYGYNIKFHHPSFAFCYQANNGETCPAARTLWGISSDGYVKPCNSFSKVVGNILTDPIDEIIDHDFCKQLRNEELLECKDCKYIDVCKGACTANAYETYHMFSKRDPLCPINEVKLDEQ